MRYYGRNPGAFQSEQKQYARAATDILRPVGEPEPALHHSYTIEQITRFATAIVDDALTRYPEEASQRGKYLEQHVNMMTSADPFWIDHWKKSCPELVYLLEDEPMASAQEEIYAAANNNNAVVINIGTTGRKWSVTLGDFTYPRRPTGQIRNEDRDDIVKFIEHWTGPLRKEWVDRNPQTGGSFSEPVQVALPEVVHIEADDEEAYNAGYDAGLTAGMALSAPPQAGPSNADAEKAFAAGKAAGAAEARLHGAPDPVDIEQIRREALLAARTEAKAHYEKEIVARVSEATDKGYAAGKEAQKLESGSSEEIIKELREKFIDSQAVGNMRWLNLIDTLGDFQAKIASFSASADAAALEKERATLAQGIDAMIEDYKKRPAKGK